MFITSNGWEMRVYQEAESGSTIEDRSKFEELLADIENGLVQKVWVIESSRLSRNLDDAIKIQHIFAKYHVELYVNDVLTNFKSSEELLSYHIQSAVSEYERSKTIERSIRGKSEWQNTGKMALPMIYGYGYTYREDGTKAWYVDEKEAEAIKLIFKLYTEDALSFNQIMKHLNTNTIKTKTNKDWCRTQIKHVLGQRIYIGQSWTTEGKSIPSEVYPAILEEDTFYKAQDLLKLGKKRDFFRARTAAYELSGIIRCALCGAPYFYNANWKVTKSGEKHRWERYYHSNNQKKYQDCTQTHRYLVKDNIELQVMNLAWFEFVDEEKYTKWLKVRANKSAKDIRDLQAQIDGYTKTIEEIDAKKNRIVEAIEDGTMTKDDAKARLSEHNERIVALSKDIDDLKEALDAISVGENDEIYKSLVDLALNFDHLPTEKRRVLYGHIFQSIEIDGQKVTVTMYDGTIKRLLIDNASNKKEIVKQ
jgi:site-specific DNA recombinase